MAHQCGSGKSLVVSNDETCWRGHCFRCPTENMWEPKPIPSLAERLAGSAKLRKLDVLVPRQLDLPAPRVYDVGLWPDATVLWFLKAGLSREDIGKVGAYWNPKYRRVVLPVYSDGKLIYWQARALEAERIKYINPEVDRTKLVAKYGAGHELVLVEDILSAYKVGKVTEAWSLMGTKLHTAILADIVQRGGPVAIWLDPDWDRPARPGQVAAKKLLSILRSLGIPVRNIVSRADPKALNLTEIREKLS